MQFARTIKALALAGAVLFAPSLASASTITLTYQTPGNIFGSNGSAGVHLISPRNVNASAGGFAVKGNISGNSALETFTAWCLDITTAINLNVGYDVTTTPFDVAPLTSARITNILALFNTGLTGLDLTMGRNSAGFQLALWELVYENTGNPFNVSVGNFLATSSNANAIIKANSLLAGLGGVKTGNYGLTFLQAYHHRSQNLVTGNPIPEVIQPVPVPAAGLLLFGALAGTGLLARLRRRKTR